MDSEGFSQAELNTNRSKRRETVRPHTEERTRKMQDVWPVAELSDRVDENMDELADPDGLVEEVTDAVETARVLAAPRTPTTAEEKSMM